ncbi:dynamin family protein [Cellulomonas edaphi]|uniref:GTPase domain-containing protein n=1 Tax=Cellulomonas edaphi TaxID=3053468 RepID=A0ABT7SAE9_9CELL|nr:GTPase domain-containing protein [Cellulomons edaphi]MDM7832608.1 GTPase domain-containing protein [Cellulomons edaphi]
MSVQPGTASAPPARDPATGRHSADDPRAILARPLASASLLDAVRDLRRDVHATEFPLALEGKPAAEASRARLVDQLDEHLVPRLTELSAPAVVVVAGSTGAGKSTLVNSLVGAEVSTAGVLRPTTRRPVLVHHPLDTELLSHHPVLESVEVVADEHVPRGIALLDAPDLDSVLESNRESAHRLLEAADLWLFVTTAARYGDALPWKVLQDAVERGASIAMVLNRVPSDSLPTVRGDLLGRLRSHGLEGSPLFVVPDMGPHQGLLAAAAVAPVNRWLNMLAGPDRARTVIGRTLRGSLTALRDWVEELAEAVQEQADAAAAITVAVDEALVTPARAAADAVRIGAVADGPVRARWAELSAEGGPLDGVVGSSGKVRGSARAGRARALALAPLTDDLTRSAAATLSDAGARTEVALRDALSNESAPAGGSSIAQAWRREGALTRRTTAAELAARTWTAQGPRVVRAGLAAPDDEASGRALARVQKNRAKAVKALGEEGLAAVALAAAAGVTEASTLLVTLVGPVGRRMVDELAADLTDRAEAQARLERALVGELLADPHLADDAAARLRLRLAVLKGLT